MPLGHTGSVGSGARASEFKASSTTCCVALGWSLNLSVLWLPHIEWGILTALASGGAEMIKWDQARDWHMARTP